jgi:hypothetical protein
MGPVQNYRVRVMELNIKPTSSLSTLAMEENTHKNSDRNGM